MVYINTFNDLIEIWNLTGCNGQEQIGFNFPQSQFLTEFLLNL